MFFTQCLLTILRGVGALLAIPARLCELACSSIVQHSEQSDQDAGNINFLIGIISGVVIVMITIVVIATYQGGPPSTAEIRVGTSVAVSSPAPPSPAIVQILDPEASEKKPATEKIQSSDAVATIQDVEAQIADLKALIVDDEQELRNARQKPQDAERDPADIKLEITKLREELRKTTADLKKLRAAK